VTPSGQPLRRLTEGSLVIQFAERTVRFCELGGPAFAEAFCVNQVGRGEDTEREDIARPPRFVISYLIIDVCGVGMLQSAVRYRDSTFAGNIL